MKLSGQFLKLSRKLLKLARNFQPLKVEFGNALMLWSYWQMGATRSTHCSLVELLIDLFVWGHMNANAIQRILAAAVADVCATGQRPPDLQKKDLHTENIKSLQETKNMFIKIDKGISLTRTAHRARDRFPFISNKRP